MLASRGVKDAVVESASTDPPKLTAPGDPSHAGSGSRTSGNASPLRSVARNRIVEGSASGVEETAEVPQMNQPGDEEKE